MRATIEKDEVNWMIARGYHLIGETADKFVLEKTECSGFERAHEPGDWENPHWEDTGRIHDWRNYISEEIQDMWDTFSDDQKKALARSAEEYANAEEWD